MLMSRWLMTMRCRSWQRRLPGWSWHWWRTCASASSHMTMSRGTGRGATCSMSPCSTGKSTVWDILSMLLQPWFSWQNDICCVVCVCRTIWNDVMCDKRQLFMLLNKVQHKLGQSKQLIFHVLLVTHIYNVWHNTFLPFENQTSFQVFYRYVNSSPGPSRAWRAVYRGARGRRGRAPGPCLPPRYRWCSRGSSNTSLDAVCTW